MFDKEAGYFVPNYSYKLRQATLFNRLSDKKANAKYLEENKGPNDELGDHGTKLEML